MQTLIFPIYVSDHLIAAVIIQPEEWQCIAQVVANEYKNYDGKWLL